MATKTPAVRPRTSIGVDKYTFFPLTEDKIAEAGKGPTYGDPFSLPGTVTIEPTDSGSTENFDADNMAYEVESYVESMGHDITNADIPPEVDAMWRGATAKDNGFEYTQDNMEPPYFGVAWRVKKSDGHYRLVRYYKGKYGFPSNVGGETKPSSGPSNKRTAQATFAATFRECDGKAYYYIDTNNLPETVNEATAIEKWFTDMNWYPSGEAE